MVKRTENCYEKYLAEYKNEFSEDESKRAEDEYKHVSEEIESRFQKERIIFDCHSHRLMSLDDSISLLSEQELASKRGSLRSEVFIANLQFFSSVADFLDSAIERGKAGFRPLKKVSKRLKLLFTSALREKILTLLQDTINKFLGLLDDIAKKLHVDSYSIGISAAFIQLGLTFKVP